MTKSEVSGLYAELARRVDERDWSDDASVAVGALLAQPTSVLTSRLDIRDHIDGSIATLSRDGDVLMGFYLDKDAPCSCEVSVAIGGVHVSGHPIALRPGEMTPFFGEASRDVFPSIAISCSEMHAFGHPDILKHASAIYGLLPTEARRSIALSTHTLPGGAVVRDGNFGYPFSYEDENRARGKYVTTFLGVGTRSRIKIW